VRKISSKLKSVIEPLAYGGSFQLRIPGKKRLRDEQQELFVFLATLYKEAHHVC